MAASSSQFPSSTKHLISSLFHRKDRAGDVIGDHRSNYAKEVRQLFKDFLEKKLKPYCHAQNKGKESSVFISYAWAIEGSDTYDQDKRYEVYVEKIAKDLERAGFIVFLDRWYDKGGRDINKFLEEMGKVDFLLPIGTKLYLTKYSKRAELEKNKEHVVKIEGKILNYIASYSDSWSERIIPVLLEGTAEESFPILLRPKIPINLVDQDYFESLFKLIRDLYKIDNRDEPFKKLTEEFFQQIKVIASKAKTSNHHTEKPLGRTEATRSASLTGKSELFIKNIEIPKLILAAEQKDIKKASLLIERGANVNIADDNRVTPLHFAARNNDSAMAKLLIVHGASLEAKGPNGETPLHVACNTGHIDMVELLLKYGANISAITAQGATPLYFAVNNHFDNIAILLLNDKNCVGSLGIKTGYRRATILHLSVSQGNELITHRLLQVGADPRTQTMEGFTPLHMAASEGKLALVKLLLQYDSHNQLINTKSLDGSTPLHWAAQNNHVIVASILVEAGADIKAKTIKGDTPQDIAINFNQQEMVLFLNSIAGKVHKYLKMSENTELTPTVTRASINNFTNSPTSTKGVDSMSLQRQALELNETREVHSNLAKTASSSSSSSGSSASSSSSAYRPEVVPATIEAILKKAKAYKETAKELDRRILLEMYGFALALSRRISKVSLKTVEKEIINELRSFMYEELRVRKNVELANLIENYEKFTIRLEFIRHEAADSFRQQGEKLDLKAFLRQEAFIEFINDLLEYVRGILGDDLQQPYVMLSVGSLATQMVTPYSDIEYVILVRTFSDEAKTYFTNLADLFELMLVSFGESPIYEARNLLEDFKDYFSYFRKGLRPDPHKKPQDINRLFGLISTPEELLKNLPTKIIHERGNHLTAALLTTGLLDKESSETLYQEYQKAFITALSQNPDYYKCVKRLLQEGMRSCKGLVTKLRLARMKSEVDSQWEVKDVLVHAIHLARLLTIFLKSAGGTIELTPNFFDLLVELKKNNYINEEQYNEWNDLVKVLFTLRVKLQVECQSAEAILKLSELEVDKICRVLTMVSEVIESHIQKLNVAANPASVFSGATAFSAGVSYKQSPSSGLSSSSSSCSSLPSSGLRLNP